MSERVLVGLAEKMAEIRHEYEMRLQEAKNNRDNGLGDYVGIWAARVAALDTVDAAMTEVDLAELSQLSARILLAHIKEGK